MFDIANINRIEKNTCIILIDTYISNIWIARKMELTPTVAIRLIRHKIMYNKCINMYRLKNRLNLVFTDNYKELEYGHM